MANTLFLVRHGENLANLTLEFSSRRVDYSLTEKGILQARQTAAFLQQAGLDAIYASPLKRAQETAEIIGDACRLPVTIMEAFREVDVGDLEGQPATAALWQQHNQIIGEWMSGRPEAEFPHGENYHRLWARMRAGVEQITAGVDEHNILVVGHGGIFTFTMADLCTGVDTKVLLQRASGNCGISRVRVEFCNEELRGSLLAWNETDHLSGEAANLVLGYPKDGTFRNPGASTR